MKNRAWLAYLIIGLIMSVAAGVTGSGAAIGAVTQLAGWSSVCIGLIVAHRSQKPARRPWVFFASAASAFLVAGVFRATQGAITGVERPFPSPADAIALSGHLLLIFGSLHLGHLRAPDRNKASFIDGAIISAALQTMVWAWVLWPYMTDGAVSVDDRAINAVYAFMTMAVLATIGRLGVGPGARTLSYRLLAGAVLIIFVQDVIVSVETTVRDGGSGLGQALAPLIFVLFGAAALHPDRLRIAEASERLEVHLSRRRVALLVAALLINPFVIGVQLAMGSEPTLIVALVSTSILTLLVLIRLVLLARTQERAVEIQRIQREANADLASASSRDSMQRAGLRAALRLIDDSQVRVSIAEVTSTDLTIIDAIGIEANEAIGTKIALDGLPAAVTSGLDALHSSIVDATPPIDLDGPPDGDVSLLVFPLAPQDDLNGALIVTTRRPVASTVAESIGTLASTVSLALESATLTENLLRRRSERRFRALIENSSDIVLVVNPDGLITFASPAANRLLGVPEQTLIDTHPARWLHPEDWPALASLLSQPAAGEVERDALEVRMRHGDQTFRWFELRTKDLIDDPEIQGLVVTAREITDRKATEEQLAASEARFRALVQNSTDVVAVLDDHALYTYISPAIEEILGYTPEEMIGTSVTAMLNPLDLAKLMRENPQLLPDELPPTTMPVHHLETEIRHRSGESRTLEVGVTDMRQDPAIGGMVINARDITVRKSLEHDLRHQALHDHLTGLANRTMFTQRTADALRDATSMRSVSALFVDVDDFKTVNDSLGHATGDQILREVAARLDERLVGAALAARLGGDEFAVLVIDDDEDLPHRVAQQIIDLVAEPFVINGRQITVTCSVGVAMATEIDDADAKVLLSSADVAMYVAKERGKNCAAVFEEHLHASVFERLEMKAGLERAVEEGELRCFYQPIVSLETGRITGVEALVRWHHPERGILSPDSFIPLAEDTGLIVPLGRWVLRQACRQLRTWQAALPDSASLTMSVNLSVRQLTQPGIVADVREALTDAGIDPSTLTLEITETTLMHDTDLTRHRLAQLRELGVSLAVDDFGTGYSSLQYVQRFPIDIIKIDKSFVDGLGTDDDAVVQSMVELAQRLGVRTVAEGIETTVQLASLRSLGADLGQGYWFSKPLPAAEIDQLLLLNPAGRPQYSLH